MGEWQAQPFNFLKYLIKNPILVFIHAYIDCGENWKGQFETYICVSNEHLFGTTPRLKRSFRNDHRLHVRPKNPLSVVC